MRIPNRLALALLLIAATLASGSAPAACGYRIGAGLNHSLAIDSDGHLSKIQ